MSHQYLHRLIMVQLLVMACLACEKVTALEEQRDYIYFNSFESPADTAGWRGYGGVSFREDAPPGGGKQSLYVSGGCIAPHFYKYLPPLEHDAHLILRCAGKDLAIGGYVSLIWIDEDDRWHNIGIGVKDTTWTTYTSKDTLFCPAGQPLQLELDAGGLKPSAMLVDLVEIQQVESP